MLEHIQVSGFKSIREMDLELRPLNILIGANGAGKSNFISLFALLEAVVDENLQNYVAKVGGAERLLYFGRRATEEILIELLFSDIRMLPYRINLIPTEDDKLSIQEEKIELLESWSFSYHGFNETKLQQSDFADFESAHLILMNYIKSLNIYHFHDTSPVAKARLTQDLHDNRFLREDASNLAAFLYFLKIQEPQPYQQIVQTIRRIAPFFEDFDLQPNALNPETIRLEWKEKHADRSFGPHYLSDGTLRFMCLATLLLQPNPPATIIIDEPELGLHPAAIHLLASLLKSASAKTQVIITTQSVTLLNQFTPEDVIVVDRIDRQSTFRRLSSSELSEWVDGYGVGDMWEKNIVEAGPRYE